MAKSKEASAEPRQERQDREGMSMPDRQKALELAVARIERDFGKGAIMRFSERSLVDIPAISSGALSRAGTFSTGSQPVALGIDPSANQFVYTANFLGNNVSGFELSSTSGSLLNSQGSPYTSNAQPTAIAAIPHGSPKK